MITAIVVYFAIIALVAVADMSQYFIGLREFGFYAFLLFTWPVSWPYVVYSEYTRRAKQKQMSRRCNLEARNELAEEGVELTPDEIAASSKRGLDEIRAEFKRRGMSVCGHSDEEFIIFLRRNDDIFMPWLEKMGEEQW